MQFKNDDKAYREWVSSNSRGFVLNVRRRLDPDYVVLHRASCYSISSEHQAPGAYTYGSYRKWCDNTIDGLRQAAKLEGRSDGSFSKRCGSCKP